jgi:hypothetical protein
MAGTQTNARALVGLVVLSMLLLVFAAGCTTTQNATQNTTQSAGAPALPRADRVLNLSQVDSALVPNADGTKILVSDFSPYVNATNSSDRGYNVTVGASNMSVGQVVNFSIGLRNGSTINWASISPEPPAGVSLQPGTGGGFVIGPLRESRYAGSSPYYIKAVYSETANPLANYTVIWKLDTR